MNKRLIPKVVLPTLLIILLGAPALGSAASAQESYDEQFLAQVSRVTVLPTSPAYFLKEWGRGIKMFFTFDATEKAEYELQIVDEKAAELSKLEQRDIGNKEEVLKKAASNYEENVKRLEERVSKLNESGGKKVEELIPQLEGKLRVHQKLLEEISSKYEKALEQVDSLQNRLEQTLKEKQSLEEKLNDVKEEVSDRREDLNSAQGTQKTQQYEPSQEQPPQITSYKATAVKGGDYSKMYEISWSSRNSEYCQFSERMGVFSGEKRSTSGSIRKTFDGPFLGTFHIYCYNSQGQYDVKWLTIEVDGPSVPTSDSDCPSGYIFNAYKDECVYLPPNAHKDRTDPKYWYCDSGYVLNSSETGCEKRIPQPTINYLRANPTKGGEGTVFYEFSWSSNDANYCELISKVDDFFTGKSRNASGSVSRDMSEYIGRTVSVRLACYGDAGEAYEYLNFEVTD